MKSRYVYVVVMIAAVLTITSITAWQRHEHSECQPDAARRHRQTDATIRETYPEIRAAAAENPTRYLEAALKTANGNAKLMNLFAEIGINAGLRAEPDELLKQALGKAETFNDCFHVMRLAFKCGDRSTAEKATVLAEKRDLPDFQKRKLQHFHDVYEKRVH